MYEWQPLGAAVVVVAVVAVVVDDAADDEEGGKEVVFVDVSVRKKTRMFRLWVDYSNESKGE
jgi:hypothetical protein